MLVHSVGSVVKSGPVRSSVWDRSRTDLGALRSGIGLALISVRIGSTKFFSTARKLLNN